MASSSRPLTFGPQNCIATCLDFSWLRFGAT